MSRLLLFALFSVALAAPQPRKLFHEHYDDFAALVRKEVGPQRQALSSQYMEFEEFKTAMDYMSTPAFKNLIFEMEDLPEFKAVSIFYIDSNQYLKMFVQFSR
jgi:hypothetical protein